MSNSHFRRVLWASAVFNLGGAIAFGFPATVGQLMGLPAEVPALYRALMALFVLMFGGSYAWLALQPQIVRPMVGFAAIGKASVFVVITAFWLLGSLPLLSVVAASGDLAFAALFFHWLRSTS
ncbi:MAG: hypothetical protein V4607_12185 [Pseudomonadota bacterium]